MDQLGRLRTLLLLVFSFSLRLREQTSPAALNWNSRGSFDELNSVGDSITHPIVSAIALNPLKNCTISQHSTKLHVVCPEEFPRSPISIGMCLFPKSERIIICFHRKSGDEQPFPTLCEGRANIIDLEIQLSCYSLEYRPVIESRSSLQEL